MSLGLTGRDKQFASCCLVSSYQSYQVLANLPVPTGVMPNSSHLPRVLPAVPPLIRLGKMLPATLLLWVYSAVGPQFHFCPS